MTPRRSRTDGQSRGRGGRTNARVGPAIGGLLASATANEERFEGRTLISTPEGVSDVRPQVEALQSHKPYRCATVQVRTSRRP